MVVEFRVTADTEPREPMPFAARTPPTTAVAPVYVLIAVRTRFPVFVLFRVPAPETTPVIVTGAVPATSIVPPPAPRTTALAMLVAPVVRNTEGTVPSALIGLM